MVGGYMKIQYSKLLAIMVIVVYVATLIYTLVSGVDTTVAMTALTVSGSVALTTIIFYMKNSWVEKTARVKLDIVKETAKNRLDYNKKMLLFLKENGLSREQLDEVEMDSVIDDIDNNSIDSLNNSIDSTLDEASSDIESYTV